MAMLELIYNIDKTLSESNACLVIKIEEAEREGTSLRLIEKARPLTAGILRKTAAQKDELALGWLIQKELEYQKKLKGRAVNEADAVFNVIHIPYSQSMQALKHLSATGKVYFNRRLLVLDLYSKVEYFYQIESLSEGKLTVSGHLKTDNGEHHIRDCEFMCGGPPHWFIKGILLQTIGTDVTWADLKKAVQQPCLLKIEELQSDAAEDAEAPRVVFAENCVQVMHQKRQPLPLLKLKDRTGAFAELFMDYREGGCFNIQDNNGAMQKSCKRDSSAEKAWEKDLLETDFIRKIVGTSSYYCPLDKVSKSLSFLLEVGWMITDWKGNRVIHQQGVALSMRAEAQAISITGKVKYDAFEADVSDVIGAFNRKERFVQLGSGTVGLIPDRIEQTNLSSLAEEGEIVGKSIQIKRNCLGTLSDLFDSPNNTLDSTLLDLRARLKDFQGVAKVDPGKEFCGELRPYQQDGLNWLAFMYEYGFHGILADDMGLGKTVQVLAFLSQLVQTGPYLIVLPTSLLFNWQREIERFLPGGVREVYLHHGPARSKELNGFPANGIVLTSYTTLRLDQALLSQISFQCVILDEAQAIKNPSTKVSQAVCALKARFRLSITGTPIENHLNEIWSHFRFLMPDLLGSEQEFTADIQSASVDSRYLQRIRKKLKPFVLRRKKEEVARDLPERIEQIVWVEMEPVQRQVYDDFLAGVKGNLFKKVNLDGISKHRMEVFEAILRLRQICCHPLLVSTQLEAANAVDIANGKDSFEGGKLQSAKLEAMLLDIETVISEGRKVLVYSQFTSMLSLVVKAVVERGWQHVYLDGSTVDREKVVTRFQEEPGISLFLISLKAGGIGLNLTAADYVFLYDPWWNEAVENQAINRAHRIGRQETVIAKRYVTVESIEEKMMKLKAAKRLLIEDVLEGDLGGGGLTEEDFRFLLS